METNRTDWTTFNASIRASQRRARSWATVAGCAAMVACIAVLAIPFAPVAGYAAVPALVVSLIAIERS